MKIIALADIHGSTKYLPMISEEISNADLILIAGDITNFGGYAKAAEVIEDFRSFNPNILAVPGNCDSPGVNEYLENENMALHYRSITVGGVTFIGACLSLSSDGPVKKLGSLAASADRVVLVTHQPAYGTKVDDSGADHHAGNRSVRMFIEQCQPLLAVSGHIHNATDVDHIGNTTLVNPGPFGRGLYAVIQLDTDVQSVQHKSAIA